MKYLYRITILVVLLVLATIPLFSSCLWILSEKESYVDDVVENKTDQHVLILGHSSKAVSYSKSLAIPAIPHIDSLSIEPNGQHCLDGYGRGDGCFELRFERLLNDDYRRQYKYNDTVFFYYPYFKSMKGTELPSMYWGNLPSHLCTAS